MNISDGSNKYIELAITVVCYFKWQKIERQLVYQGYSTKWSDITK